MVERKLRSNWNPRDTEKKKILKIPDDCQFLMIGKKLKPRKITAVVSVDSWNFHLIVIIWADSTSVVLTTIRKACERRTKSNKGRSVFWYLIKLKTREKNSPQDEKNPEGGWGWTQRYSGGKPGVDNGELAPFWICSGTRFVQEFRKFPTHPSFFSPTPL